MQTIFGKGLLARPCKGRGARGPRAPLKCPGAGAVQVGSLAPRH